MTGSSDGTSAEFFDATPFLKLVIDKDGRWFQNGAEIVHPSVYRQFCAMLEHTADGGYQVRMDKEVCRVEVEDAPFVILRVMEQDSGPFLLLLNDGTTEPFDPDQFWIGEHNVPYCTVKNRVFHARFSRPAYYQLASHIVQGQDENEFFIEVQGKRVPVKK